MKMRSVQKSYTNCFSRRHQRSWHNGWHGVGEHLHFLLCIAWFGRHYCTQNNVAI